MTFTYSRNGCIHGLNEWEIKCIYIKLKRKGEKNERI